MTERQPSPTSRAVALAAVSILTVSGVMTNARAAAGPSSPPQPPAVPPPAQTYATTPAPTVPPATAAAERAAPAQASLPSSPKTRHAKASRHAARRTAVQTVLHNAEERATEVPKPAAMVNATLHYAYEPGKLYTIHTAPSYLTAVVLRPGEHLISKAAGDTVRWEVGETTQGNGQVVILLKPLDAGLRTNMILTTDQRVYVLDLVSSAAGDDHSTLVDWRYPNDDMRELTLSKAAATVQTLAIQGAAKPALSSPFISPPGSPPAASAPARLAGPAVAADLSGKSADGPAVSPADLNFGYKIEAEGHRPSWMPEHVFDDGRRVFVKFPANVATMDIPPLFVIGPKGEAELVNYRFENGYYVVDRLFQVAELRLGSKNPTIVQLVYKGRGR